LREINEPLLFAVHKAASSWRRLAMTVQISRPASTSGGNVSGADTLLILTVLGSFVAIIATGLSPDPLFRFQGYIFVIAGVLGAFALLAGITSGKFAPRPGEYMDGVVRAGVIATMFWGIAGMLAGVAIAAQLAYPKLFYFSDFGFLNFGRLRPLHTSAVIFAFGGNILIASSF
jgi:cytochrome c oxidase cbb3-type subunit 1